MSRAAWRPAPAKLNLGLRVIGRRPDGYHLLDSLFVPLDLADRIRVEVAPAIASEVTLQLVGTAAGVPAGPDNLVVRAAHAFLAAAHLTARVEITLEKRVPPGAGLGGGSSDAATVLLALSENFANAIAREELAGVALSLGADVPFFLDPRPARVTGIGEQVVPIAGPLAPLDLLLVTPAPPLATRDVFRTYDAALTPTGPGRRMPGLRGGAGGRPIAEILGSVVAAARTAGDRAAGEFDEFLGNDLEPAARQLHTGIERVRRELERLGARAVAMSGSGPTVFGIFPGTTAARNARRQGRWETTDRVIVARSGGAA